MHARHHAPASYGLTSSTGGQALVDAFPLLYPGTKAVFFPLNAIFLEAKNTKAKSYGFTNILDACYNGAVPGIAAPANAAVCTNPDQYIYWARARADHLQNPRLTDPELVCLSSHRCADQCGVPYRRNQHN